MLRFLNVGHLHQTLESEEPRAAGGGLQNAPLVDLFLHRGPNKRAALVHYALEQALLPESCTVTKRFSIVV